MIIIASGSKYTSVSPMESCNVEGPYFRVILGFVGITDITIVHAGGTIQVAQGAVTEPVFLERFVHDVDFAASR
jgi:FMN-dependent NADH-azoreductase